MSAFWNVTVNAVVPIGVTYHVFVALFGETKQDTPVEGVNPPPEKVIVDVVVEFATVTFPAVLLPTMIGPVTE